MAHWPWLFMAIRSTPLVFPESLVYWSSLLYHLSRDRPAFSVSSLSKILGLNLPVIPLCYFLSWLLLLFPQALKGYQWSVADLLGLVLVICGNILVMRKKEKQTDRKLSYIPYKIT